MYSVDAQWWDVIEFFSSGDGGTKERRDSEKAEKLESEAFLICEYCQNWYLRGNTSSLRYIFIFPARKVFIIPSPPYCAHDGR
jgi:hypothetical protein